MDDLMNSTGSCTMYTVYHAATRPCGSALGQSGSRPRAKCTSGALDKVREEQTRVKENPWTTNSM